MVRSRKPRKKISSIIGAIMVIITMPMPNSSPVVVNSPAMFCWTW